MSTGAGGEGDDLQAQYARLLGRIEANEREFRRLGRSVWRVQEDERRRLARELHDGIGQNLTALKHRLALIGSGLGPGHEELRSRMEAAIALCTTTLDDTRQLSRMLRPPILDDLGLEPALRWLLRTVAEPLGWDTRLALGPLPSLDGEVETVLFRVAQEALNNAAKHAQARHVALSLQAPGRFLRLCVEDDGRGLDESTALASGGSGLGGMRERLRLYGGTLELHSAPDTGTRIMACLPLDGS